jgi:hypothetical protein
MAIVLPVSLGRWVQLFSYTQEVERMDLAGEMGFIKNKMDQWLLQGKRFIL